MRTLLITVLVVSIACAAGCRSSDSKDDGGVPPGDGTPPGDGQVGAATIFKITDGTIKEGEQVTLDGVVVSAVDNSGQYTGDLFVQDPAGGPGSGLKLFRPVRVDGGQVSDLKVGDLVKVEGTVKYWPGPTSSPFKSKHVKELDPCQVTRLGPGTPPTAEVVSVADLTTEPTATGWESVLVQVKDVKVLSLPDTKYGDFDVTGGLGVDDELYAHTPQVGDCINVTGIAAYFYQYYIDPRDAADIQASTGCAAAKQVTVMEIQDENSTNHPAVGDEVVVNAVITAVDSTKSGSASKYYGFFIQDPAGGPHSGIYIYHSWDDSAANKPNVGELVELTGTYDEYPASATDTSKSVSELKNANWTSKGPGTMPQPAVVNAADVATGGSQSEQYEGVLVTVQNVTVSEIKKDSSDKPVAFKDATSGLFVDHDFFEFLSPPPAVGTVYSSVTGPLHYSYSEFRILPRDANDLVQ